MLRKTTQNLTRSKQCLDVLQLKFNGLTVPAVRRAFTTGQLPKSRARAATVTSAETKMDLIRPDLIEKKYGGASNLKFNEQIKALIKEGNNVYHFGFGESPFPVFEAATEALKKYAGESSYLHVQGLPELRESIVKFHQYYDQVTLDPEDIVVGPGSKQLILLLMTVFNGDILINSPAWTTYKPQAELSGRDFLLVKSHEKDEWRVTPEGLEDALAGSSPDRHKVLILCNPCNPTGTCYTEKQLLGIVETCRKHKTFILCDEIYGRLNYSGQHICISKVYPEGGILCTGFSKWAGAGGWRMGYQVFPKELRPLLSVVASAGTHSYSCAPSPMQYAFAEVMQNFPACDEYIQHTNRIMAAVADFCTRELRSVGVSVVRPHGGFYMFPNFEVIRGALEKRGVTTGQAMCDLMLEEIAIALLPGGPAHLRREDELTTRLCYVNFDGAIPLRESRLQGLDVPLDDTFVKVCCPLVYEGIMVIKAWVTKLKE